LFGDSINLLQNKDTFYFEYFKRPKLSYTKNKPINFTVNLKCHNRNFLNLTENNYVVKDYGYKNYTILNDTDSLKNAFKYFINENNITSYLQPDLYLKLNFFEMKSITPAVSKDILIERNEEELTNILNGTKK
jgi:mannosyltransferase OCH1-like enzyme